MIIINIIIDDDDNGGGELAPMIVIVERYYCCVRVRCARRYCASSRFIRDRRGASSVQIPLVMKSFIAATLVFCCVATAAAFDGMYCASAFFQIAPPEKPSPLTISSCACRTSCLGTWWQNRQRPPAEARPFYRVRCHTQLQRDANAALLTAE